MPNPAKETLPIYVHQRMLMMSGESLWCYDVIVAIMLFSVRGTTFLLVKHIWYYHQCSFIIYGWKNLCLIIFLLGFCDIVHCLRYEIVTCLWYFSHQSVILWFKGIWIFAWLCLFCYSYSLLEVWKNSINWNLWYLFFSTVFLLYLLMLEEIPWSWITLVLPSSYVFSKFPHKWASQS